MDNNLRKKNREEYNKFLVGLNELRAGNEMGSIKSLAYRKITGFIEYSESKGVYYFVELPISSRMNSEVLKIVEESVSFDNEEATIRKDNLGRSNISLVRAWNNMRINSVRSKYFELYGELNDVSFQSLYYRCYIAYYKELLGSISKETLKDMLDKDYELAVRLGMEEEFIKVREQIEQNKCKVNVIK